MQRYSILICHSQNPGIPTLASQQSRMRKPAGGRGLKEVDGIMGKASRAGFHITNRWTNVEAETSLTQAAEGSSSEYGVPVVCTRSMVCQDSRVMPVSAEEYDIGGILEE